MHPSSSTHFEMARFALRRFVLQGLWIHLLVSVGCDADVPKKWDGCPSVAISVTDADLCYDVTSPVNGVQAWEKCSSIKLSSDIVTPDMRKLYDILKNHNSTKKTAVWVGGIEIYPNAGSFVTYDGNISMPIELVEASEGSRRCVALNTSGEFILNGLSCDVMLPMLCVHRKFVGVLHNAEAEEACNITNGVVMEPLQDCYQMGENCSNFFTLLPEFLDMAANLTHIERNHPVNVKILKIKINRLLINNDTMETNGTTFCFKSKSSKRPGKVRLELRYNETAGGPTLWVKKPGRVTWPPKCVGGRVANPAGDPRALLITPSTEEAAPPVIWCYVMDFFSGSIAVSNSIMRPDQPRDKCPTRINGLQHEAVINEKASCLRCLKEALSPCPEGTRQGKCNLTCDEKGCGHFSITLNEWSSDLKRREDLKELKDCAMDEVCAGDVIWELTDGGDCNGDGIDDCDDRLKHIFDPFCGLGAKDPRESSVGLQYWECRTDRRKDFFDVLVKNGTDRYFCEDNMPTPRRWALPIALNNTSPSTFLRPTTPKTITQKASVKRLHNLVQKLKPNVTITKKVMESTVKEVTKLLDVDEQTLLEAKNEANVSSSLAEIVENIVVRAPNDFNLTTNKLAVSKERASGCQALISDNPTGNGDSFGPKPRQISLENENQLNNFTNQVEAAVIVRDLPQEVAMVLVTYAKTDEFIPSRPPPKTDNQNITYLISPNNSTNITNETAEIAPKNVSENNSTSLKGIVYGCINTHVLQVSLVNENGSYLELPDGKYVDLIFRPKMTTTLGQVKTCVYWDFKQRAWFSDGCELMEERNGLDTCRCTHLTHFAQLVSDGNAVRGPHAETLRVLSVCACAVSLSALAGVLSAGVFARKWRRKKENKIIINLAVALSMYMALFLWSAVSSKPPPIAPSQGQCEDGKPSIECQVRGAALHYFVLSSFCWMLIAAATHYLRFTTLMGVAGVPRFVLKASAIGWGVPIVPIAILMGVEADSYAGKDRDFCYPSGYAFYGAVLAPICAVLLANAVLFVLILRRLFPRLFACADGGGGAGPRRAGFDERREFLRKVLVCVAFIFLFGLSWYLGLLSFAEEPAFVFCVVMMCQGPALLGFFVLGEETVRNKLKSIVRRKILAGDSSGTETTNISGLRYNVRTDQITVSPQ